MEHERSAGLQVERVGLLLVDLRLLFLLQGLLGGRQRAASDPELLYELDHILLGADEPPEPAHPLGVLLPGLDVELHSCHIAVGPQVETIDDLHEGLLAMFDGRRMHLLALDQLEPGIMGDNFEQVHDLASADIKPEDELHV